MHAVGRRQKGVTCNETVAMFAATTRHHMPATCTAESPTLLQAATRFPTLRSSSERQWHVVCNRSGGMNTNTSQYIDQHTSTPDLPQKTFDLTRRTDLKRTFCSYSVSRYSSSFWLAYVHLAWSQTVDVKQYYGTVGKRSHIIFWYFLDIVIDWLDWLYV